MSSNYSIGSNITNSTYVYNYERPLISYISFGVTISTIVVGTILNLWFLVAILCSQDTRSRLRNKIICNSLVLHLVDSVVAFPLKLWARTEPFRICMFYSAINHLVLIQDFIGNWLLVMLLVIFIAQIVDFNPTRKLSPGTITLGTIGLLVFPWVASLVLVPVIEDEYSKRLTYRYVGCSRATHDTMKVLKSLDMAVPIIMAILLVIVAVYLRYRRLTRGYSSRSMQTELESRGPEIDKPFPYIVATAVCVVCDLFQLIFALNIQAFFIYGYKVWMTIEIIATIMSNSRVILMPLPWLLLPDIRQQIRAWRPWFYPAPGTNLVVTFKKEEK